jgi:hypothetical protein
LARIGYNERVTLFSGNFRINYVYRILPNRKTKKLLQPIEDFRKDL